MIKHLDAWLDILYKAAMSALVYLVTCIEMDFTEHPSKVGKTHLSEHFRSNSPSENSCETIEKQL